MQSTGSLTYDALLERLHRRPFQPFVINRNGGEKYFISRQFQMATNGRIVVVAPASGDGSKSFHITEVAGVADVTNSTV